MDRFLQPGTGQFGQPGEDDPDERLHVAGAAPVELALTHRRFERFAAPFLPVHRHHVGVPGEHDAAGGGSIVGGDGGQQVGLGALGVMDQGVLHPDGLQFVDDLLDQRQVGVPAGGVEADQFIDFVQGLLTRCCAHCCS